MRFILGCLLVAGCSCAHGKQIKFTDDSTGEEAGWVCVAKDKDTWTCVSIETFAGYVREADSKRTTDL